MAVRARYTFFQHQVVEQAVGSNLFDYVPDAADSTVYLLDSTQSQASSITYNAFGDTASITGSTSVAFRFRGSSLYETEGILLSQPRVYRPILARWLTPNSPYGFQGNNPQSKVGTYFQPLQDSRLGAFCKDIGCAGNVSNASHRFGDGYDIFSCCCRHAMGEYCCRKFYAYNEAGFQYLSSTLDAEIAALKALQETMAESFGISFAGGLWSGLKKFGKGAVAFAVGGAVTWYCNKEVVKPLIEYLSAQREFLMHCKKYVGNIPKTCIVVCDVDNFYDWSVKCCSEYGSTYRGEVRRGNRRG